MYDYAISFLRPDLAWAAWITAVLAGHGSRALMLESGRPQTVSPGPGAEWIPLVSTASLRPETPREWWWWIGPEGEVDVAASPVAVGEIEEAESAPYPDLVALARDHDQGSVMAELRDYLGLSGDFAEGKASVFGLGMPLYPPLQPGTWNVPPRNPYFTGRQEALDRLRGSFARQPDAPQCIAGPAGTGKTTLAIEYAHRYCSLYRGCLWLDGERHVESRLRSSLRTAAEPGDRDRPWLLIVDDASGAAFSPPEFLGHCHVLVIAEQPGGSWTAVEEPGQLSVSESLSLARRLLSPGNRHQADGIARLAAGDPLATWLLSYLANGGTSALAAAGDFAGRTDASARLVLESMSSSFPASAELLNVMAASAPAPLPVLALYAGVTALPARLATAVRAQPDLVGVTEPLARAGLLRRDQERLVLHQAARRAATETACGTGFFGQAANAVAAAVRALRHSPPGDREWDDLLPHLLATADTADRLPVGSSAATVAGYLSERQAGHVHRPDVVDALNIAARHFALAGQPEVARELAGRTVRLTELHGAHRAVQLTSLAQYDRLAGRPREAMRLLEEAQRALRPSRYTIDANNLVDEHEDLLCELALTYSALGDHASAATLAERNLSLGHAGMFEAGFNVERAYYVQAAVLRRAGRLAEAREALEQCLAAAGLTSEPDWTAGAALRDLAQVLVDLDEPVEALDVLSSGIPLLESWFGPDHPATSEALLAKARALSRISRTDESALLFTSVLAASEQAGTPGLSVDALVAEAEAMFAASRISDSMTRYREAIEHSDGGPLPARNRIMVRHVAALAFLKAGAAIEAAQVMHAALDLLPETGHEGSDLAPKVLQRLGEAELAAGDWEAALRHGEQARVLISAAPTASIWDVINNLYLVGRALVRAGRSAEAVPLLTDGCERAESSDEVPADAILPLQSVLAMALRTGGDAQAALEVCRQALAAVDKDAAALAQDGGFQDINKELGAALLELGLLSGALQAFRAAVRAAERLAGSHPVALTSLLTDVGTLLLRSGHPAEASTYFRRVWHHQRETLGSDSVPAARSLDGFAQSWAAMGHPASAVPMHRQALVTMRQNLGDHPDTAIILFNLAQALIVLGQTGEAIALLEQAVQIDQAAYGPDHLEVATDLNLLAAAFEQARRPEEARQVRQRAKRILNASNKDQAP
jgi:tetratricopeptide (TPR) repeat protein